MTQPSLPSNARVERVSPDNSAARFLVLDPEKPSWVLVNEDGLEILSLCDGKRSVDDIARVLSAKHDDGGQDAILSSIAAFLEQMERSRLLREADPEESAGNNTFHGLALEITARCNLRCVHCYLAAGEAREDELSFDEICKVLDDAKVAGGVSVAIGGGEPLLREDCIRIIEHALSRGLLVSMGTNGTLLDDSTTERLAGLPIKLQISLDGASQEVHDRIRGNGSYSATMAGIERLIGVGMAKDIVIAFTPMKPNFRDVSGVIDLALGKGIPVVQFPPLALSGRTCRNASSLFLSEDQTLEVWAYIAERSQEVRGRLDLLADCFSMNIQRAGFPYRCTIGTQFRVDPSGYVYPCQCFHSGVEFCLGNLRETPLGEMVGGQKIAGIKKLSDERRERIQECRACEYRNFCGGGCMGRAFERHGTVLRPTDCEVRRRWIGGLFEAEYLRSCSSVPEIPGGAAGSLGQSAAQGFLHPTGPKER